MKQQRKRRMLTALVALVCCAALLAGCSNASAPADNGGELYSGGASMDMEQGATATDGTAESSGGVSGGTGSVAEVLPEDRKIILNASMDMETTDFTGTCTALREAASEAGGYLEHAQQDTPSREGAARYASFTFRVPTESYSSFLSGAGEAGNVTNLSEDTDDVTAQYVDTEARIAALTAQRDQLLAMLGESGSLETMITIQDHLSEVQYQLESYERQKRLFDDQVSYSTVSISVHEVVYLTEPAETFGQKLSSSFTDGWRSFGNSAQNVLLTVVYMLPVLLMLAVLAAVVVLIVYLCRRRAERRQAKAAAEAAHSALPAQPEHSVPPARPEHDVPPDQPQKPGEGPDAK